MNVQQILSQFQSRGVETCFHGRHINPQIYAGLDGNNWHLQDYIARGGYQALRKILGVDGGEQRVEVGGLGHDREPLAGEQVHDARADDGHPVHLRGEARHFPQRDGGEAERA